MVNRYALYKFKKPDGKDFIIAKWLPNGGCVEIIENQDYIIKNIYDALEEFEEIDFYELAHKAPDKLSIEDFCIIGKALKVAQALSAVDECLEPLLFHEMYRDNFVKVVSDTQEDFSWSMADFWLE